MNRCVLKTFGKKMAKGTLVVLAYTFGAVAIVAVILLVSTGLGERGNALMDEFCRLTCLSSLIVIIPLAIGSASLEALKDSYKECGR